MPLIRSKVDRNSDDFAANFAANQALALELEALREQVMQGGSERSRERHVQRGKLLPRDRIRMLLDTDSPFLEIGQLAAWQVYEDEVPAAGIVCGIGRVHGSLPAAPRWYPSRACRACRASAASRSRACRARR